MQPYDSANFDPPTPVAVVTVKSTDLGIEVNDVPMLLDTGADVTLLPRFCVQGHLISDDLNQYEIEGFDGTKSSAPAVRVEMLFMGKSFRGQFLLIDGKHGIIGRNVLNNLSLYFNGPARTWELGR